jgi:hypothetical protein
MRNPPRKAVLFAALALSGAAVAWLGVQWYGVLDQEWVSDVMFTVGFTTTLIMLVLLIQALFHVRGMAKLKAGFGRVAQWRVSAVEWDKFRTADSGRVAADPTYLGNDLWIRKATPPEGVDVIVGEKSLIVDNSYHILRMNGLPELRSISWLDNSATAGRPPDCLEFLLAYPRGRYGGIKYTTLRVPVPQAEWVQGRLAYDQFAPELERRRARGPIALRNPRRTLQVCGVILAISLATTAWGWVEAERVGWNMYNSLTPLFLLLGGGAGAFFALLLAGLTLLLRPKAVG